MPNWKKVIVSGSDAALNTLNVSTSLTSSGDFKIDGAFYDNNNTPGTSGQMLLSTATGIEWADNIAESAQDLIVTGKNMEAIDIPKGTPLYFSGSGTAGNVVGVYFADAGDLDKMPAGGVAGETITSGNEGDVYIYGFISGVDTSAFAAGDSVFVGVGGGYTNSKPTGSALIQKLGNVEKAHPSNGSGVIQGPSWYNDVPNITSGYTWVGNSDQVATAIATSSIQNVVSSSYAVTASYAQTSLTSSHSDNSIVTASISSNIITFSKGDGTTFPINVGGSDELWTIELIDAQSVDFYAPYDLIISSSTNIVNSPTIQIKDDGVTYTLGNTISVGSKITVNANMASVVNLNITY